LPSDWGRLYRLAEREHMHVHSELLGSVNLGLDSEMAMRNSAS